MSVSMCIDLLSWSIDHEAVQLSANLPPKRRCGWGPDIFEGSSYLKMELLCGSSKFFSCTLNGLATALANLPTAPWDKVRATAHTQARTRCS